MLRTHFFKNILLVVFCLQGLFGFAQKDSGCGDPDDKKAVELYNKGIDMKKYQKAERDAFLKQAIELQPDYVAANFALAEDYIKTAYTNQSSFDPAVPYFMTVINNCPHYHSDPYYYVGLSYYEAGKYADAITYLQKYLDFKDEDVKKYSKNYDDFLYDAKQKLKDAKQKTDNQQLSQDIMAHKVPFDPHLVKGISSQYDDFFAVISPDNQLAFFTRKMPLPRDMNSAVQSEESMKEYFMISHRKAGGTFENGSPLPPPFNRGSDNEGGPAITIDNNHFYFSICKQEGNCQVYYCDFASGQWGDIKNAGEQINEPSSWTSQPSISSDGQTLYFASNRPGGNGKCDIWESTKDADGNWGPAANLGPTINSRWNDISPFIHTDSHTLYFSSDRPGGVGGFDVYYSRMDSTGEWSTPKNLGYPINSDRDEVGFVVSTDGRTGYFDSDDPSRTNGESVGGKDIYEFELYPEARPERVALVKGAITDNNGNALTGATVSITDAKTHKKASVMSDTTNASFTAVVNESKKQEYVVTVNKEGYAFNSGVITAKDTFTGKPTAIDFNMQPVSSGGNYVLNDIYYKSNSAQLESISIAVVKEFAKYMRANPDIKVKIAGYTDNVGSDAANQVLSSNRASTVMQALVNEGIQSGRLSYQGYGAANPVANNDTEEGRQKNRRTEFIITQK